MDEKQIIEATEKFLAGNMSREEMQEFRELRDSRPDIDKMVVEYSLFLTELGRFSDAMAFRNEIRETERTWKESGITAEENQPKTTRKIFSRKNRETIAVAASVAGIIALIGISIISAINSGRDSKIKPLVEKIKQQEKKANQIEKRINQLAEGTSRPINPKMEAKFRATGFLLDPSHGYLLTNAHVVRAAKNSIIIENNKGQEYRVSPVYINSASDIAILKIDDSGYAKMPPIPFSIQNHAASLGESIFILGFPKEEIVYGEGYISAMNGYEMDSLFYQLSTPANEGNSGSPIINRKGELLGVISSMQTNAQGVVFATKADNILNAVEEAKLKNNDLTIQSKNMLKNLDRTGQVKKLKDYIFMVKGN